MEQQTVLLVDDDREIIAGLRLRMSVAGHRVLTAYNGQEGVAGTGRTPGPDRAGHPHARHGRVDGGFATPPVRSHRPHSGHHGDGEPDRQKTGPRYGGALLPGKAFRRQAAGNLGRFGIESAHRKRGAKSWPLSFPSCTRRSQSGPRRRVRGCCALTTSRISRGSSKFAWNSTASTCAGHSTACRVIGWRSTCPDVIVTDMVMPDGEGTYVMGRLKSHPLTGNIPVIVLSGQANPALKPDALPRSQRIPEQTAGRR